MDYTPEQTAMFYIIVGILILLIVICVPTTTKAAKDSTDAHADRTVADMLGKKLKINKRGIIQHKRSY